MARKVTTKSELKKTTKKKKKKKTKKLQQSYILSISILLHENNIYTLIFVTTLFLIISDTDLQQHY